MAWAGCAAIAKTEQKHVAAATDRHVGTLDKHLPSPTIKFPQNAPRGRPIESDEEDNDDDGRSVDLHVPLPAPPPPAPRVLAPPLPLMTEPTHAKGGASGASATGMALASPPPRHRRPIHSVTTRTTTTKGARSMRTTSTCPRAPTAARAARARAAAADDDRADARGARPRHAPGRARERAPPLGGYPERESNPQRRRYIGDGHQARANKVAHALNR